MYFDDADIEAVKNIADDDDEVSAYSIIICFPIIVQVHKNDFILHIKNSRMLKDFEVADPASEFYWKKKAD